ncbi:MAG: cysteine rich repeat-containing protein [Leptospiraceae bacterium]|nr:cysteine rich repeat-containing protein [Leptospiraceae bacterium]
MKNLFKIFLAVSIVFSVSLLSHPKEHKGKMGMGVCKEDIQKYCKDVPRAGGKLHQCMDSHLNELSVDCKKRHTHMNEEMKDRHAKCSEDIHKFCSDVEPGQGRMRDCMQKNKDKLSPDCKKAHNF